MCHISNLDEIKGVYKHDISQCSGVTKCIYLGSNVTDYQVG